VDSNKYVDVTEAVHGYHTVTSENKVLAPARPVPKYKTDMLTKAAKPQTLLRLLITSHHAFQGCKVCVETRIMVHIEGFQEFIDFVEECAFMNFHTCPKTMQEILCNPSFEKLGGEGPSQTYTRLHTLGIRILP